MDDLSAINCTAIDCSATALVANPNGDAANFVDPPSQAGIVLGVGIPLIVVSTTLVSIRLFTNYGLTKRIGVDDWLCLIALILTIVFFGLVISVGDTLRHIWDIPISAFDRAWVQTLFILTLINGPIYWFSRASIFALYIRLFGRKRWLRWTCYVSLVVTFILYFASVPVSLAYCLPRGGGTWDFAAMARCGQGTSVLAEIHLCFGIVLGIFLMVLPLPVIWTLKLEQHKKLGLAGLFLVGIIALVATITGVYYRLGPEGTGTAATADGADPFWNIAVLEVVTLSELCAIIIVSCAPALFSFWNKTVAPSKMWQRLSGSADGSKTLSRYKLDPQRRESYHNLVHMRAGGKPGVTDSDNIAVTTKDEWGTVEDELQRMHIIKTVTIQQQVEHSTNYDSAKGRDANRSYRFD